MHDIILNGQKFTAPSKWDELTAKGLLNVALCTQPGKQTSLSKYFLIVLLFGIPQKLFLKLIEVQRIQMLPLIGWLSDKNTLSKWLISTITLGGKKHYGPKDKLANITMAEFIQAEASYERYLQKQEERYLDELVAVLYRPKKHFALKRDTYDPDKLEAAERKANCIRPYIKQAIALNYAGCRNLIISRHDSIWKIRPDEKPIEKPVKKVAKKATNWISLVLDLSGDKFGTYEQTMKVNVWLVLADMNKKSKLADELAQKNRAK